MNVNNVVFNLTQHTEVLGKQTIEVRDRDNGSLLGTITQGDRINTIRFISRHDFGIGVITSDPEITVLQIEVRP